MCRLTTARDIVQAAAAVEDGKELTIKDVPSSAVKVIVAAACASLGAGALQQLPPTALLNDAKDEARSRTVTSAWNGQVEKCCKFSQPIECSPNIWYEHWAKQLTGARTKAIEKFKEEDTKAKEELHKKNDEAKEENAHFKPQEFKAEEWEPRMKRELQMQIVKLQDVVEEEQVDWKYPDGWLGWDEDKQKRWRHTHSESTVPDAELTVCFETVEGARDALRMLMTHTPAKIAGITQEHGGAFTLRIEDTLFPSQSSRSWLFTEQETEITKWTVMTTGEWFLGIYSNGSVYFQISDGVRQLVSLPDTVTPGRWQHIAVVQQHDEGRITKATLFVDSKEVDCIDASFKKRIGSLVGETIETRWLTVKDAMKHSLETSNCTGFDFEALDCSVSDPSGREPADDERIECRFRTTTCGSSRSRQRGNHIMRPVEVSSRSALQCKVCASTAGVYRCVDGCEWCVCASCWFAPAKADARDCAGRHGLVSEELGGATAKPPLNCPRGHELETSRCTRRGCGCDACGGAIQAGTTMHSCRRCGFDMCDSCAQKKGGLGGDDARCSVCAEVLAAGVHVSSCKKCDHTVCQACSAGAAQAESSNVGKSWRTYSQEWRAAVVREEGERRSGGLLVGGRDTPCRIGSTRVVFGAAQSPDQAAFPRL